MLVLEYKVKGKANQYQAIEEAIRTVQFVQNKFDRETIAVKPHYTSQKCSQCGAVVKKSLSVRTHVCKCGCSLNRDENAAINILNLALQARGGHPQSNAVGVGVTTLVGATLLEQTLTLITESPLF